MLHKIANRLWVCNDSILNKNQDWIGNTTDGIFGFVLSGVIYKISFYGIPVKRESMARRKSEYK